LRAQLTDALFDLALGPTPAEHNALCLRPRQPGIDTLADHAALKLGEHAEHLEHGLAGRRGGVERLLMQV
jgi:hypothetical protein